MKIINEDGSITVWMSLTLFILIGFILILYETAKINTAKIESEESIELALQNVMSDYDPNIFKYYNIFIFDNGYGESSPNLNQVYNVFENSVKENNGISKLKLSDYNLSFDSSLSDSFETLQNQVANYMNYQINEEDLIQKYSKWNSNYPYEKLILVEYLIKHFSSFYHWEIIPELQKEYIYELEYIICGQNEDNKNIEMILKKINNLIDNGNESTPKLDIEDFSKNNYEYYLINLLLSSNIETLYERTVDLIIANINKNFNTSILKENCFFGVSCKANISVHNKINVNKILNKTLDNTNGMRIFTVEKEFLY